MQRTRLESSQRPPDPTEAQRGHGACQSSHSKPMAQGWGWGGRKPESRARAAPLKVPGKVLTLLGACFSICKTAVDMSSASFKLF